HTLRHNLNRQQTRVRLFESGLRFLPEASGLKQKAMFAGLVFGDALPEQWGSAARPVDFFDLKGDVEQLLDRGPGRQAVRFEAAEHPALHPGQSARLVRDGQCIGWIGALHPRHEEALDLPARVYLFELSLEALMQHPQARYVPSSRFPAVRRDLAFVVETSVSAATLIDTLREAAPPVVRDIALFDVYQGQGIAPGNKSLALSLTIQDFDRTLNDSDVQSVVDGILAHLKSTLNVTLRE
ncbi:MAG: phenylalanine--tRNA ligase subunit beta, partial [Halothiobacillaceae bacterium]|nr:phenylalanine--tRNA ligase subunit beta [Halothiobacillaceae bacterium]